MSEPTTEAGRAALLHDVTWPDAVLVAIEQEARRDTLAKVRAAVAAKVRPLIVGTKYEVLAGEAVFKAILAILDEMEPTYETRLEWQSSRADRL